MKKRLLDEKIFKFKKNYAQMTDPSKPYFVGMSLNRREKSLILLSMC